MRRLPILMMMMLLATALVGVAGCGDGSDGSDGSQRDGGGVAEAAEAYETVEPADVIGPAAAGELLLVDVREPHEWEAGHAPSAMHVPLARVGERLDEIRERADGRPVAFICRSGNRSAEAAAIAAGDGVEQVRNVDGGMQAWVEADGPLEPADGTVA